MSGSKNQTNTPNNTATNQGTSLGVMEARFADIIWAHAPLPSGELVQLCKSELGWQKSTTYTMLRRLCQKGLFQNTNGQVRTLISKADFQARQSEDFLQNNFAGSLPRFLAAFTSRQRLSAADVAELEQLIAQARSQAEQATDKKRGDEQ